MKINNNTLKNIGDVITYNNRYGDAFTFELLEDGNIQWAGDFKYIRVSYANDYSKAYSAYCREKGSISLSEFKEEVHKFVYDDQGNYVCQSDLMKEYGDLITSDRNIIDMVDPSGGPYICRGMDILGDRKIINFRRNETGYLIILE
jgi:hypothetical protein